MIKIIKAVSFIRKVCLVQYLQFPEQYLAHSKHSTKGLYKVSQTVIIRDYLMSVFSTDQLSIQLY